MAQRVADDGGVFVEFLFHEVAVVAFADGGAGEGGQFDVALDLGAGGVMEGGGVCGDDGPVAIAQVGDAAGQGGEGQGVGACEHFAVAEADGEGGAVAGGDHQFGVAGEDHGQGVGAFEAA